MTIGALDKVFSKTFIVDLINAINQALLTGAIASAAGTVTTALADLATERDKH